MDGHGEELELLRRWDCEHVWHAFSQMAEHEPFLIREARGCTLVDVDGREFLDGVSSMWCNVHGHGHPTINRAIREQLDQVAHVTLLGASHPTTVRLARRLAQIAPGDLPHVFFSSDGSSAIEVALKLAFQYWQQRPDPRPDKTQYLALGQAYHGDTLGSVSVGGVDRFHAMFGPLLFPVVRGPCPDTYRLPTGVAPAAACEHYLAQFGALLEAHHHELAAVVAEPLIQCAAGMIRHPDGLLEGLRKLTREYDVLLIVDEVATGFGRTGTMFACQQEDVEPDFLCLGKGLTGGYLPLAATLTTAEVWQAFQGAYAESRHFYHGHTYSGNPLSAAAAMGSLDVFDEEGTLQRLPQLISHLQRRLARLERMEHVGSARQCGLIGAVELVLDREYRLPFPLAERRGQQVCDHARSHGVWLRPLGNVVVIMPPLSVTTAELDRIMDAVESGLQTI